MRQLKEDSTIKNFLTNEEIPKSMESTISEQVDKKSQYNLTENLSLWIRNMANKILKRQLPNNFTITADIGAVLNKIEETFHFLTNLQKSISKTILEEDEIVSTLVDIENRLIEYINASTDAEEQQFLKNSKSLISGLCRMPHKQQTTIRYDRRRTA